MIGSGKGCWRSFSGELSWHWRLVNLHFYGPTGLGQEAWQNQGNWRCPVRLGCQEYRWFFSTFRLPENSTQQRSKVCEQESFLGQSPGSASIESNLQSGISIKSGISTLNRLLRHAIQEIGSPAHPQSSPENNTCTGEIFVQNQAKELKTNRHKPPRPPLSLSNHFPGTPHDWMAHRLLSLPLSVPEIVSRNEATKHSVPISKGKGHSSTPLHQMPNHARGARSSDGNFISSEPSQASIAKEDKKSLTDPREVISPYVMKLGSAAVPTLRFKQRREKIMEIRATSTSIIIIRGKYIPPQTCEGPTQRQVQVWGSSNGFYYYVISGKDDSTYSDMNSTPVAALELNIGAQPFNLSDDAMTKSCHKDDPWPQAQDCVGDVKHDTQLGPAVGQLSKRIWKSSLHDVRSPLSNYHGTYIETGDCWP